METTQTDRLDRAFHALSDPTRRAILRRLAQGDADVSELTKPFGLSQPTISKHLDVLESAGFIRRRRDAQRRPRTLVPTAMNDVTDWLELFRKEWESRFDNLASYVAGMGDTEE